MCDVKSEIRLRQSMRVHFRTTRQIASWSDYETIESETFLKRSPQQREEEEEEEQQQQNE